MYSPNRAEYVKLYRANKENYLELKNTQNKGVPLIIITVTHSVCLQTEKRTCDLMAEKFADVLGSKLDDSSIEHRIIKSSQSRYLVDDNRIEAPVYQTELWKELGPLVKGADENVIILDIHSFPSTSFDNKNMTILANYPLNRFNLELAILLGAQIKGGVHNAIIDFATSIKQRAVLLEVNETLGDDQIEKYVGIIAGYLKNEVSRPHKL